MMIQRTAHYHIQEGTKSNQLLYIIHGYGQLAEDFLREFEFLKESPTVVVAPEAISKFYNKERKAVANWMTSHEREDEILDYVNYLESLHQKLKAEYPFSSYSLLAFSQGTSTALRWLKNTKQPFQQVYLCSGSIPPEITKNDLTRQKECQFSYFYGDQDPLLSVKKGIEQAEQMKKLVQNVSGIPFEGSHIISSACKQMIKSNVSRQLF